MPLTLNLKKKIHTKVWEPIFTPTPAASAAGTVFVGDNTNLGGYYGEDTGRLAFYITGVSSVFLYNKQEEGFMQLPNSGLAGTWGAGSGAFVHPYGPSFTATAGTTSSFTSNQTILRDLRGMRFRVTSGTNRGIEGIIRSNTIGANSVITTVDTYAAAFDNTSVIQLLSGRLWVYVPGATSGFGYYDYALNTWTSRSVTSGPAATAGEGCLVGTPARLTVADYGTATAGGATSLTNGNRNWTTNIFARRLIHIVSGTGAGQWRYVVSNTATVITVDAAWATNPDATSVYEISGVFADKASAGSTTTITVSSGTPWTASQWVNYQVRIVGGTGAGQVSQISANTNNGLTFATLTTAPDSTSYYVIEPSDDYFYYTGNNATTLFRYVGCGPTSTNTWSSLTARGGALTTGGSALFVANCEDVDWISVGTTGGLGGIRRQNGRYIYSWRGGATVTLDIYDTAANTWTNAVTFSGSGTGNETWTTGSVWTNFNEKIYVQKDATGRFFEFDVIKSDITPLNTNNITQGAAIVGARLLFDKYYDANNGKDLKFLTFNPSTSSTLQRMLLI